MRRLLAFAAAVAVCCPVAAEFKPHPLFSNDMVLQRGEKLIIWGSAEPGEAVKVILASLNTKVGGEAIADSKGKWSVTLPPQKAGTGYTLEIRGANSEAVFKNVAIGDVWICSGQSNMEWTVGRLNKEDQGKKVAAAANHPNIRLFTVKKKTAKEPESTVAVDLLNKEKEVWNGKWQPCTPDTVNSFSAVGYFFGRDLEKALNVPIGLIHTSWGGTPAEAWTSKEKLESVSELKYYADRLDPEKVEAAYQASLTKWKEAKEKAAAENKEFTQRQPVKPQFGPNMPASLYNAMIAPLLPFAIKGAIWYQGESNAGKAAEYRTLMPALIEDWRKKWGKEFPFFIVQLAPFRGGASGVDYAELRDAQVHTTKVLKGVGIAVITDVGDKTDIHPQRKEPVGGRLALAARAIAYGEKVEYSGPMYKSHKIDGNKVTIIFDHAGKGLECKGDALAGFAVCGEDKKFVPAKAEIVGDAVVVSSTDVPNPVAVRFGWVNFAEPTLNFFNKDGLPAVPFRTDDFPLTTAKK
jgi:sialate O-acetylesterase